MQMLKLELLNLFPNYQERSTGKEDEIDARVGIFKSEDEERIVPFSFSVIKLWTVNIYDIDVN